MKKTFFKNLFRDIQKTISRFLSIVIIIAVGVSFYAGVRATSPDMKKSADSYFGKNNFMDFKLVSTMGLTNDDLSELKKQNGISKAEGSYSTDAVVEYNKSSLVLNINSMPNKNGINQLTIVRGRKPQNTNEAVVEEGFFKENSLKLGSKLKLQSGNSSNLGDTLKNVEFTIVGTAISPLYVSAQRQLSSVGNGSVKGFVYILPEVFKNDVFTEIYVQTNGNEAKNSLTARDAYNSIADSLENSLKKFGLTRSEIRYKDILSSANSKIAEAEDKLNSSKKEAEDKFADGYSELDTARAKIADGKAQLKINQTAFNNKIAASQKQLDDSNTAVSAAEKELTAKAAEIANGETAIADGKKQLDTSEYQLNSSKQQAASGISSAISQKVDEAKTQLDANPGNQTYLIQYNSLKQLYDKDIYNKDFDSIYNSLKQDGALGQINQYYNIDALKSQFDKGAQDIITGRQQLSNKETQLNEGAAKLEAGKAEITANKEKLAAAQKQLDNGKQEGLTKLSQGSEALVNGENELNENTEKLKAQKADANQKFKAAEDEIQRNKDKLKDIKNPEWYVLGRSANVGYETYRQDSDRIDNIGKAFPLIFFLVAALVSLTTMTRMVQENRIEIGTFKALGYSRTAIVAHYLIYSFAASLLGSIIGISFGFRLFPPLIMNAYSSLYTIPDKITPFNYMLAFESSLIAVIFTTAAAAAATLEELREVPASLMRPKPPKSGKAILLERITFLWKRLSFTRKVTARNIFRYKQRFLMTVIGIAACTGLMITGYGIKEGVIGATENQFNKIYRYDMQASLTDNKDEASVKNIKTEALKLSNIRNVLFYYSKNAVTKNGSSENEDFYLTVPENKEQLNNFINLTMNGKTLSLTADGVIITEKLSKITNKKPGDILEITVDNKTYNVKIAAITEHYVQHYMYMSPEYYKKLFGQKPEYNSFYGILKNTAAKKEDADGKYLTQISGINSVSFKNNLHFDYQKSMNSINSVVLILISSAGVLAFVVIYNLTNINISERNRELATIKLLGFYDNELAMYIYRENIILTVIGSLFGIILGLLMNRFIVNAAETNVMMFLRSISPVYFLYSILLTLAFSIVVNIAMYKRFDKINMIEALKNAE